MLALITGASSGIGATFARALAQRGYDLVLVARRKERLEQLGRELEAVHKIRWEALAADLTVESDLERIAERIASAPDLDLLVNNAGFGAGGRYWQTAVDRQMAMYKLHVLATARLTHAALGGMVTRGRGAVINVSSVAGFLESPGTASYNSTKCWMNHFTATLWMELKGINSPVKVQALCPGFTYSEFHDVAGVDRKTIAASLWMQAADVVNASLRGLDEDKLFVIPGWRYKALVFILKTVPKAILRPFIGSYAHRRGLK